MEFQEFLLWLSEPGGITVAAGVVFSIAAERIGWYQALSKEAKELVFGTITVAIPLLAAATRLVLGYAGPYGSPLAGFEQLFWPALVAGVTALASGTAWHAKRYAKGQERN